MKKEEQQKSAENEKDIAKNIQEKAFKGGQNAVTTYKSDVKAPEAPKMELPKGGGALRSIGEKFEANPVTGTANISVPVAISPGRNGFQPELSLSYSSGGGNGIFGMGWGVGLGSISRKTAGRLPQYNDADESDVFLLAGFEDLVPKTTGDFEYENLEQTHYIKRYQPRTEGGFARIEKWTAKTGGAVHWKVTDRNNMTSVFGESVNAKVFDSENPDRVFEWKIEYKYDALGNYMRYNYLRENETGGNQLYPRSIQYSYPEMYGSTGWDLTAIDNKPHFEVIFNYGENDSSFPDDSANFPDWPERQDPFSTFKPGFEIRTQRLCRKINMYHRFDSLNSGEPFLVKSTEISYDENPVGSQLQSVQHKGFDDTLTGSETEKAFPPVSFSYTQAIPNPKVYTLKESDVENLPAGIDGQNYTFADPEGEGINGILTESANAWYFKPNLGHDNFYVDHPANYTPEPTGSFGALQTLKQKPNGASIASLQDIDGDGKPEAVIREAHMAGFYKQKENGEWGEFQYFENHPNLDFQSEDVKFIDLNGDGRADILITKQDTLEWIAYQDNSVFTRQEDRIPGIGYGHTQVISRELDEEQGPRVVFSNGKQNIFLSDMTGDGFSDLVRIENGSICYWPNKGYGRFGAKVVMSNVPAFDYADQFDANRIRLGDIDGSGTTDLIYLGSKSTNYFINQSGNSLADGVELVNFPTKDPLQYVQLADILGNGTSCLVWSSTHEKDKPHHMKYLDLMGGQKPYLLEEMDNGMGALRKFSYVPSTKFYLRDKLAGKPWVTKLSFPVQTLERVEVYEQITQSRFVTRYAYHHGYYDPVEKEFRGFGMVEQWDTELYEDFNEPALYQVGTNALEESSHSEPVYTKSWFHNGYFSQKENIEAQYATEYWKGDTAAFPSAGNELPDGLEAEELRQAYRALKGSALRQEVYGLDVSGNSGVPYSVTESAYKVLQVQERGANDFAIFRKENVESRAYSYEQNATDPRVSRQLLLESDEFGTPITSATVVFGRRSGTMAEQLQDHIIINHRGITNIDEDITGNIQQTTAYRKGATFSERFYELRFTSSIGIMSRSSLRSEFLAAPTVAPEDDFSGQLTQRKLFSSKLQWFYKDDLSGAMPFAEVSSHGLPMMIREQAFTEALANAIYNGDGTQRITDISTTLTDAGYIQSGDLYYREPGRMTYDLNNFFLPLKSTDPFGNETTFVFDTYSLFPLESTDPLDNQTQAVYNYIHLQPELMTDPNGNRQQVVFDALGMPVKMMVMGKDSSHPAYVREEGDTLDDPGTVYEYDLFQFQLYGKPNYSKITQRETHIHDPAANNETRTDISFTDGLGKTIQTRNQYGDYAGTNNSETEVIVSGRQVTNNKDLVIEQYEPYFDTGFEFKAPVENTFQLDYTQCGNALEDFIDTYGESSLSDGTLLSNELNTALSRNLTAEEYYYGLEELNLLNSRVHFNGSGDIDFGDHPQYAFGTGDFATEAWVKVDANTGIRTVITNLGYTNNTFSGFNLIVHNQNEIRFVIADGSGTGADGLAGFDLDGPIPTGEWTHVVTNRIGNNADDWQVFINGVQENTVTIFNSLISGDMNTVPFENLKIGSRRNSDQDHYFTGKISGVKMYNRALTSDDVLSNYNQGVGADPAITEGLVFSALLHENNLNTFADSSSYKEIGTVNGTGISIQYEFNSDWATESYQNLSRIRMHYDVLGRNTRVDYEDGTFEKVEFDAWCQKNYDRNDTVVESQWFADRISTSSITGPEPTDPEERAACLSAKHYNTPQVIEIDSLGRAFLMKSDNGNYDGTTTTHDYYEVRMQMSIDGKQEKVTNPLMQETLFSYNLLPPNKEGDASGSMCYTDSPDGGWRRVLMDVVGNPIMSWNERGFVSRNEYDQLLRPIHTYVDEGSGEQLVAYQVYGDNIIMDELPEESNLRGQVIRSFDQSGVNITGYVDFKGNVIQSITMFAEQYSDTINWSDIESETNLEDVDTLTETLYLELDGNQNKIQYKNVIARDALNRPILNKTPSQNFQRYSYNKASLLIKVENAPDNNFNYVEYISNITYNARGQRTNVYYGNNSKTRYDYDPASFRMTRLLTTRNTGADILQDLNYTFDAVGNIVEQVDDAQQTHYFSNSVIAPVGKYEYDAVYRLVKATGRERDCLAPTHNAFVPEMLATDAKSSSVPTNYSEVYTYDEIGNILSLQHTNTTNGTGNWTRHYNYSSGTPNNYLQSTHAGSGSAPATPEYTYDVHGNVLKMTHLSAMDWDFTDQLKNTVKNNETTYYVYSGGQRVRKIVVDTSGTPFVKCERRYLGTTEWFKEFDSSGTLEMERLTHHISHDTGKVASLETKTTDNGTPITPDNQVTVTRYQYNNHLGSACLELNENAEVLSYEEYHPFGSTSYAMHTNDSEVSLKRYKYNGKERDEETNLDYYGARYYASWLCRFVSVDPQKDNYPMQNSFAYAANSPVTMVDVNGENPDGGDENVVTATLREAAKAVEIFSPSSAYSLGVLGGVSEGVGEVAELAYRLSFGAVNDLANGNETIYQEFVEGISALSEALSTAEGRDAIIEGLQQAVSDFYEDATFQNGAFDAGLTHGQAAFNVLIGIATGGGGNAVKLLQAIKQGPKAVAAVLKSSLKSSIKPQSNKSLNSSNELLGVERASKDLIESVSKKRDVIIAKEGSEDLRMLDYFGAEASVGGENMTHILLRENPSKAAILEEFLHGTQQRLGIIDDLGRTGAEAHVKDFMIRHKKMLGLSKEDVIILQKLKSMGL